MKKETHFIGLTSVLISLVFNICLYGFIYYYGINYALDFSQTVITLFGFGSNGIVFVFAPVICFIFGSANLLFSVFLKDVEYEDEYIDDEEYSDEIYEDEYKMG